MKSFSNFENPEKIYSTYQRFLVSKQRFVKNDSQKYVGGVPLMYDKATETLVVDPYDTHTLVYGATGSLKSRSVVMPTMKVLGIAGESMIINDSKGELYSKLAAELQTNGFNIIVINLREPALGNAWNPLYIPYKFYKQGNIDKAAEFANDVANNLVKGETSSSDPFWDYSAADLLFGLIMLLFKYAKEHSVSETSVNIGNIIELRRILFSGQKKAKDSILWKYASEDELISASLSGSVFAPNDTMNSILSVFDQKMRSFTIQPTLLDMLANNDIDIAKIGTEKTAVFLITPDEKTTYHMLVSLFIKQSYEYLIYTATLNKLNRVENRINYILDEFSSLPAINDMPAMISAARSRDIRFLLIVQSKHQLKKRYKEEADTIISNCSNWIFLTSRELELLRELSELCGEKANRTPNISVYDLQHLSKSANEAIVLCGRMKPAFVTLLDIDKFGGKKKESLGIERYSREKRSRLDFELKEDIKDKYKPINPFGSDGRMINPFEMPSSQSIEAVKPGSNGSSVIDIDEMIKKIDQKIEELEKEEQAQKDSENMIKNDEDSDKTEGN